MKTRFLQACAACAACALLGCAGIPAAGASPAAPQPLSSAPPPTVQQAIDALAQAATPAAAASGSPLLQILWPKPANHTTDRAAVSVVGRTHAGHRAFVSGDEVPVASTGVFVKDQLPLTLANGGVNRIELKVLSPSGASQMAELTILRQPPAALASNPTPAASSAQLLALAAPVEDWPQPRPYVVGDAGADLTWGLHDVRLGGPNLAELPSGTRLMVDGQRGDFLRVRLTRDYEAWTAKRSLTELEHGASMPPFSLGNLVLAGGAQGDTLSIPWHARVPFAVRQTRAANGNAALEIELFGGHLAATWLTHRLNPQVVEVVQVEQTLRERVVVRLNLRDKTLWGYQINTVGDQLQVTLRAAPPRPAQGSGPLARIHVALEAGHGGLSNLGAVGITGAREKDVNLATSWLLKQALEQAGARVSMVREGEENPTPTQRARLASATGAHLFVSVHANSSGTERGFLNAQGTASFYKHEHGRLLASAIHRRMLQATGLPDYGLVGNFNYTPIRLNTGMPSALVELGFLSNPYEEAVLLDPAARQRMAHAIRDGVVDFICQSLATPCPAGAP